MVAFSLTLRFVFGARRTYTAPIRIMCLLTSPTDTLRLRLITKFNYYELAPPSLSLSLLCNINYEEIFLATMALPGYIQYLFIYFIYFID